MVWGVCRRLLNHHDAEDAFQAAFLVLARKAASIRSRHLLGNWLYGVAQQAALQARRINARRRARESQVAHVPEAVASEPDTWHELRGVLDAELSRLPDRYRSVIVLCDLEGQTRKEAARHFGCPEGTVAGRLSRARTMLAKRLARHGLDVSGGAWAVSALPTSLVTAAIAGPVPASVAAITEGVLGAMTMTKLKTVFLLAVTLALLGWGGGVVLQSQAKAEQEVQVEESRAAMADLSGTWQGNGWGTVVLKQAKKGEYAGTYTDTYGKDVGRITVVWSTASGQYEGTWSEAKYRFGRIALEAKDGETIAGAYTTDPKCEHRPGVPSLANLRWCKVEPDANQSPAAGRADFSDGLVPATPLKKTLLSLDKQMWDAAKTGDWKVYDRLMAKDYVGHSAVSGRHSKSATVESVKNRRCSVLSIRDVEVTEVSRDVAILTYVYSCKVTSKADGVARTYIDRKTSLVWANRDGTWVLVFCQETADDTPAAAADSRKTAAGGDFPSPK
jgi:RNA polymerase sigma factor (sigma-70 family)